MAKTKTNEAEQADAVITATYMLATECRFNYNDVEYCLSRGNTYDLPADSDFVQSLLAQQILQTSKF